MAATSRRASRADVAERAGVSHGTVSHVLNHPERVRPETRAKVEAAIADLGFIRDEAARHLRAGYSTTIALILLDAYNPSFIEIARGIEDRTSDERWTVLISNSARNTGREQRSLREFAERRVAGLIVIPNDQVSDPEHRLPHGQIPMVTIDRLDRGADGLSVAVDDELGGQLAADHLLGLGHRRITFVGDPDAALPVRIRFDAFRTRIRQAGADVDLEVISAPLTVDAGLEVGRAMAEREPEARPTAMATAVDLTAIGVLQSLLSAGIRVPEQMSLIGYDDIPFTAQLSVPLTTITRPHHQMGRTAADLLLQTLEGHRLRRRNVVLQPMLTIRSSTAPPPGNPPGHTIQAR